jgi:hypothetical protein
MGETERIAEHRMATLGGHLIGKRCVPCPPRVDTSTISRAKARRHKEQTASDHPHRLGVSFAWENGDFSGHAPFLSTAWALRPTIATVTPWLGGGFGCRNGLLLAGGCERRAPGGVGVEGVAGATMQEIAQPGIVA